MTDEWFVIIPYFVGAVALLAVVLWAGRRDRGEGPDE